MVMTAQSPFLLLCFVYSSSSSSFFVWIGYAMAKGIPQHTIGHGSAQYGAQHHPSSFVTLLGQMLHQAFCFVFECCLCLLDTGRIVQLRQGRSAQLLQFGRHLRLGKTLCSPRRYSHGRYHGSSTKVVAFLNKGLVDGLWRRQNDPGFLTHLKLHDVAVDLCQSRHLYMRRRPDAEYFFHAYQW